jgi:methionyl-tRNA synthetase
VAAERAGVSPERFAGERHAEIAASFERLGISFDLYTRTHTQIHTEAVRRLFLGLHRSGYIDEGLQPAAWCPRERRSLPVSLRGGALSRLWGHGRQRGPVRYVRLDAGRCDLGEPRCRSCGAPAELSNAPRADATAAQAGLAQPATVTRIAQT